jgi:HlyD family secretion protein
MKKLLSWMKRRWWIVAGLLLLAVVVVFIVRGMTKKPVIKTVSPANRDILSTLSFSGHIDAHERVSLHFNIAGKVVYVGAQAGDTVKKGQTLISLDQRSVQKNLESNLNSYMTQRLTFETAQDNRKDRWISTPEQRTAQKDQLALNQTVNAVELQNYVFDNYRLSAPFTGILTSAPNLVAGYNAAVTDVFEVVNPQTLYFQVQVDEVDIDRIQVNQEVLIQLDATPDFTLHAKVTKIAYESTETSSGTVYPIEVTFTDPVDIVHQRLGMNGEARFVLADKKNVLSIPLDALIKRGADNFVKVKRGNSVVEQKVQTGIESDEYVEITGGLNVDDAVVLP